MVAAASPACPRCGTPRTEVAACPRCGLATARMDAFAREREAQAPDALRTAWDALGEAWEAAAPHDRVLALTVQHGCYAWTAGRYRAAQGQHGVEATAPHLVRIRRAAEAALLTAPRARDAEPMPYRGTLAVLALIILMILIGLAYAMYVRSRGPLPGVAPAAPSVQVR